MPETLSQKKEKVEIAEVVRHGEKIVLPNAMSIDAAITTLTRRKKYEEEVVQMVYPFEAFVWDGAYALGKALEKRYGWVQGKTIHGFFEDNPPKLIKVEVSRGKYIQVPWGVFKVPGVEGTFTTAVYKKDGRINFEFIAEIKHKYEDEANHLRDDVQAFLDSASIYRGQAISIRFRFDGEPLPLPQPSFLDLSGVHENELVFPEDVQAAIETNLFTPIDRLEQARALGVPIKRGVLLAGDFGVGKTLSAYVAAKKAVAKKITFIYCKDPEEFAEVMHFAAQYSPAVVFCEDVDRIAPAQRDSNVDAIINVMDGVDTKNQEIITVLTTNEVGKVNQALLRPGRLDAVIHVKRPDAAAVVRLVRLYAGRLVKDSDDLSEVGRILQDNIPAVIREVCERSKLAALRYITADETLDHIPPGALVDSAKTMKMQLELLSNQHRKDPSDMESAMKVLGYYVSSAIKEAAFAIRQAGLEPQPQELLTGTNGR